jgi:DNA-binding transcriptional MerR regulator
LKAFTVDMDGGVMLKISDFSRLGHVTVRALRFYERIGLLKPSHVDDWTGYRYYSAAQLPRLNRILTLKDLGLSLVEIAQLLDEEVPAPRLRRVLELKQLELQQRVEDEQARLRRVAERLRQIEQEGTMSHYDVVLKEVEAQTVASAREVVSSVREMPERCGAMSRAVYKLAEGRGLKVVGACMAIYHDQGSYREEDIDTEMAVPVEGASADESGHVTDGTATIRALPAWKAWRAWSTMAATTPSWRPTEPSRHGSSAASIPSPAPAAKSISRVRRLARRSRSYSFRSRRHKTRACWPPGFH